MDLRSRRKALGLTIRDVACSVGVSHVAVIKWEQRKTVPRIPILKKIAKILQCTQEDVLGYFTNDKSN